MKKIVSALAVLAVVGSALAFKPYGQGKIFCFTATNVNTSLACDDQAHGQVSFIAKLDYKVDGNGTTTVDPCLDINPSARAYDNATAGQCNLPSQQKYSTTGQ